uniref:Mitochondrial splicing suppressor 51-like C-terminal domain-containing protein n=1 Tax=Grammatophora oceanica TaxID=210454 RepID=A0A7S1Y6P1_9STRA
MFNLAPVTAFIADAHSNMLTLQHILGDLSERNDRNILPEDVKNMSRLVIHILGGTDAETSRPGRYVEMTRFNPNLTEMEIHFVGPELVDANSFENIDEALRMEKIRSGCQVKLYAHCGLYHEIIAQTGSELSHLPPTVVLCPHPGVHDAQYIDMWRPTIEYLMEQNVPLVLTGCNIRESQDDSALLRRWGATMLMEPRCNPFRGLWPTLDPGREFGDYYYANASFCVFKGKE